MEKIIIFDTTLRDGEQSPGVSLNKKEKLLIAKRLEKLNVDVIEAGFPASSKEDFESVEEIAKNISGPIICGLARAVKSDIDFAWNSVKYSKKPRIHVFIATSKIHIEKKLKMSKEEILENVKEMVKYAKSLCRDIEFSPEDASRTDIDFMIEVIKTAINSGANTINIPDTVGYAEPEEFGNRIKFIFEKIGNLIREKNVIISVHCHDDLGNAVANSLAGIKNGALQIECTINGIGERAGNCSLEEAVMNLKTRKDYFEKEIEINTKEIFETSKIVSELTGMAIQKNKAIVGANAFAHEAGIHQHGIINDKLTYEIICPESVGWKGTNLVIGKHSGKHAIEKTLTEEGFSFDESVIREITDRIKEIAGRKKEVSREEIIEIANNLNKKIVV